MDEIQSQHSYFTQHCSFAKLSTPNELEKAFAADHQYSYFHEDFLTGNKCLKYFGKYSDEDKFWLVANYYNYSNRLRACETSAIQGISSVDAILKDQNFASSQGCNNPDSPITKSFCETLKGCQRPSTIQEMILQTRLAEAAIRAIRDDQIVLMKGPYRIIHKKDHDEYARVTQQQRQELLKTADARVEGIKTLFPWLKGPKFESDFVQDKDIESALRSQLGDTRTELSEKLKAVRESENCMLNNTCDMKKVSKLMMSCPNLAQNLDSRREGDSNHRKEMAALGASSSCEETRQELADYKNAKIQFGVDMTLAAVTGGAGLIKSGTSVAISATKVALNLINLGV